MRTSSTHNTVGEGHRTSLSHHGPLPGRYRPHGQGSTVVVQHLTPREGYYAGCTIGTQYIPLCNTTHSQSWYNSVWYNSDVQEGLSSSVYE